MKKLIKIFGWLVFTGVLISCEADDKDPIPFEFEDGGYVKFQESPNFALDVSNINEAIFAATIIDPIGNAVSYDVGVIATVNGTLMDTIPFKSYTEFPIDFQVTPAGLAAALGIDTDDLAGGDSFKFVGAVTTEEGLVYTPLVPAFSQTEGYNGGLTSDVILDAEGYRDALSFTINFVCPFDAAQSAGTYQIITDGFETSAGDDTFEVIAGPGENQITMVNPFDHINPATGEEDYEVTITVDPETGVASIPKQEAWHCANFGCSYGQGFVNTAGSANFVFSCNGAINVFLQHTVGAGSFGTYKFVAKKVE